MKKVLFLVLLVALVIVSLVACENKRIEDNLEKTNKKEESTYTTAISSSGEVVTAEVISTSGELTSITSGENSEELIDIIESGENIVIKSDDPQRYSFVTQNPVVTMEMVGGKKVKIELYPQIAPTTVENFISLINKKYYNGLTFHRVMPNFMAQGGDPQGNGLGGPGYYIKGEFVENGFAQNTLKHDPGVISMARATPPDSAGSQFFIVTGDNEDTHVSLDGKYAGFGKVIEGMDVVYEIVRSEVNFSTEKLQEVYDKLVSGGELTNSEIALLQAYQAGEVFDRPVNPPVIKTMTVDTFGVEYLEPQKIKQ